MVIILGDAFFPFLCSFSFLFILPSFFPLSFLPVFLSLHLPTYNVLFFSINFLNSFPRSCLHVQVAFCVFLKFCIVVCQVISIPYSRNQLLFSRYALCDPGVSVTDYSGLRIFRNFCDHTMIVVPWKVCCGWHLAPTQLMRMCSYLSEMNTTIFKT